MAFEEAVDSFRKGLSSGGLGVPISSGALRVRGGIESLNQFCEPPFSTLPTLGAKRLPYSAPGMEAIDVEWAITPVATRVSSAGPKQVTGPQVPPVWVEFRLWFHDVTLPQRPPNQWINSLTVRFAYTWAAALGETMMVV